MPYVTERWLGGTLTNFQTIRSRLDRLEELEQMLDSEQALTYSKKALSSLNRERRKIQRNLEGIRHMTRRPEAMFVIDPHREKIAVSEARKLGVKVVALMDTDCDPDLVDLPIPGNDDSMRSIELITQPAGPGDHRGQGRRPARAPGPRGPPARPARPGPLSGRAPRRSGQGRPGRTGRRRSPAADPAPGPDQRRLAADHRARLLGRRAASRPSPPARSSRPPATPRSRPLLSSRPPSRRRPRRPSPPRPQATAETEPAEEAAGSDREQQQPASEG